MLVPQSHLLSVWDKPNQKPSCMSVNEQMHEKEPFSCQFGQYLAYVHFHTYQLALCVSQLMCVYRQLHPSACSCATARTSLQHWPAHMHLRTAHPYSLIMCICSLLTQFLLFRSGRLEPCICPAHNRPPEWPPHSVS